MRILEFLTIFCFLLAGAAGENSLGMAFVLVLVSFGFGWLATSKRKRRCK